MCVWQGSLITTYRSIGSKSAMKYEPCTKCIRLFEGCTCVQIHTSYICDSNKMGQLSRVVYIAFLKKWLCDTPYKLEWRAWRNNLLLWCHISFTSPFTFLFFPISLPKTFAAHSLNSLFKASRKILCIIRHVLGKGMGAVSLLADFAIHTLGPYKNI